MFLKTGGEFIDNLPRLTAGVRRRIGRDSEDGRLGEQIDQIDDYIHIMLFLRDREGREAVCIQKSVQNGYRRNRRKPSRQPNWLLSSGFKETE